MLVPVLARNPTGYRVLSPCGNEVDLVYGQPVWEATVVLDPGHGGDERGAIGPDEATEAEVNLDVARRAGALLEAQGVAVVLTRSADYRIPVRNRAAIADQLQAKAFVSIHHNAPTAQPADGPGSEVYVQSGNTSSRRLGGLIYQAVTEALAEFDVDVGRPARRRGADGAQQQRARTPTASPAIPPRRWPWPSWPTSRTRRRRC